MGLWKTRKPEKGLKMDDDQKVVDEDEEVVEDDTKTSDDDQSGAETGHCMKCKEKREMKDTEEVEMKNGRKAMKGICTTCGTKMFKILGTKKAE